MKDKKELTDTEQSLRKILHTYHWAMPLSMHKSEISSDQAIENICKIISTFGGLDITYNDEETQ